MLFRSIEFFEGFRELWQAQFVGRWTLDVGRWTLDVGRWTVANFSFVLTKASRTPVLKSRNDDVKKMNASQNWRLSTILLATNCL